MPAKAVPDSQPRDLDQWVGVQAPAGKPQDVQTSAVGYWGAILTLSSFFEYVLIEIQHILDLYIYKLYIYLDLYMSPFQAEWGLTPPRGGGDMDTMQARLLLNHTPYFFT